LKGKFLIGSIFFYSKRFEKKKISPTKHEDEVAEWLRRWTANPMGSARVGSNPILVEDLFASTRKISK
jgi:hypothetical protein